MTGPAITFDTGALVSLERRKERAMKVYAHAKDRGLVVATPNVTVAEWCQFAPPCSHPNCRVMQPEGRVERPE